MDDVKARRNALGWSRAELARRAGVDRNALQLIELGQWSEVDALTRVARILSLAESGQTDVHLPPPELPKQA